MKCTHCGKEISNDSNFCEFCGKKVSENQNKKILRYSVYIILAYMLMLLIMLISSSF